MNKKVSYDSKDISSRMVSRLTEYLGILKEVKKYEENINSIELATKMNSTASQVRKDLSTFGEFGVRAKGYSVEHLIKIIEHILGIDEENEVIIIGYGRMGTLLSSNADVLGKGFKIVAVFDKDPKKVGLEIDNLGLTVKDISELKTIIKKNNIKEAILAINKENAQELTDVLVKFGIKAILNLTSYKVDVPRNVAVVETDFSAKLQELNFWRKYNELQNENRNS